MTQVIAEVLLGLFRSWEFIFITLAIMVLLPIVFSVASMDSSKKSGKKEKRPRFKTQKGGPPPVQEVTRKPRDDDDDEDEDDEPS